jgi:hypothetical protein
LLPRRRMPGELLKSKTAHAQTSVMWCSTRKPGLYCRRGERQENCTKVRQCMLKLLQCRVVGGGQDCCLEGERQENCSNYSNAVQLQKAIIAVRGTLRELLKSTQMSTYINNNLLRD